MANYGTTLLTTQAHLLENQLCAILRPRLFYVLICISARARVPATLVHFIITFNPLTDNDAKRRARLQLIIGYRRQTALATSGKSNACHFEFFSKLLNNEDIEGFYSVKRLLCQLLDEVLDRPSRA